jgi:hypothetical protein
VRAQPKSSASRVKIWRRLRRLGLQAAWCTVERLMRELDISGDRVPLAAVTVPASRSCTYCLRISFAASLATFGRLARRSACHCAVEAR